MRVASVVAFLALVTAAVFVESAPADSTSGCTQSGLTFTCTFQYTGAQQTFSVPAGVTSIHVDAVGAPGGSNGLAPGGLGGTASADLTVTPGQTLFVEVGGAGVDGGPGLGLPGWNGGGAGGSGLVGTGGGGGGASDVRTVSCAPSCPGSAGSFASRLVVAGGGGGTGSVGTSSGGRGGDAAADGTDGQPDVNGDTGGGAGLAGGTSAGGAFGAGGTSNGTGDDGDDGAPGDVGRGGWGGANTSSAGGGGGGGGGLFGGGGAGAAASSTGPAEQSGAGGGGGGSSSAPGGTTGVAASGTAPSVTITYTVPAPTPQPPPKPPQPLPGISIFKPADGAKYIRGQKVLVDYRCQSLGGPAISSCQGPVGRGSKLSTKTAGKHTFTVTASDEGGAVTSKSVTYTVLAPPRRKGIVAQVTLYAPKKKKKGHRTIKFTGVLSDSSGTFRPQLLVNSCPKTGLGPCPSPRHRASSLTIRTKIPKGKKALLKAIRLESLPSAPLNITMASGSTKVHISYEMLLPEIKSLSTTGRGFLLVKIDYGELEQTSCTPKSSC